MSVLIRNETDTDSSPIWKLNQTAFGGHDEADLVDALRAGGFVSLSLVAELNHQIVGHILFGPVSILDDAGSTIQAASLAPMAVAPNHQRQGIGSKLVNAGLAACRAKGDKIAVVLGHPDFYPRFGFSAAAALPLTSPFGGGDAWMAIELERNALSGVSGTIRYPPPFGVFE